MVGGADGLLDSRRHSPTISKISFEINRLRDTTYTEMSANILHYTANSMVHLIVDLIVGALHSTKMPASKLTDSQIKSAIQQAERRSYGKEAKNVLLGDGLGLYLAITPKATASWLYRYSVNGKAKAVGLGAWPTVGLKAAREAAEIQREYRSAGVDPATARRRERIAEKQQAQVDTSFQACAITYIEQVKGKWRNAKHETQWHNTLKQYAFPVFGKLPISELTKEDILAVLRPIWITKHETATRLRGRIEQILDWAIANDLRTTANPAKFKGLLEHRLPSVEKKSEKDHHPSLPYKQLPDFMRRLQGQEGMARWALEMLVLCGNRTKEITHAQWSEFDFTERLWTIPGERMKGGIEHRIPLTTKAIEILKVIRPFSGEQYVFITGRRDTPMSNMAMAMLLRRMGETQITVHGFRSSFRMWAGEKTEYPFEVCEQALAHGLKSGVAKAYLRSDFFVKRVGLMNDWAAFALSGVK
jgi:integrase